MNNFLRADLFIEIVDLLPPAFLNRIASHTVMVKFDEHWHSCQAEDWGQSGFPITFYVSEDHKTWEFDVDHNGKRYPVDMVVETIRRLPTVSSTSADFVTMYVLEEVVALCPTFGDEEVQTAENRNVMFHKAYFDNPNGGRARLDWAIRIGRKQIDE